jgi:N-acyl-D-amino-acid deacylase
MRCGRSLLNPIFTGRNFSTDRERTSMGEAPDFILRRGSVIDGTGSPPVAADVAVKGDRILAVGRIPAAKGVAEIDAEGKIVAPGFIDVHTHDDRLLLSAPDMTPKVSQGVTTVVVGNCGVSLAPLALTGPPPPPLDLIGDQSWYKFDRFADYLAALDHAPPAVNAACLVGHSTLRVGAMDRLDRAASPGEISAMKVRLQEALEAGAIGLSTGLGYEPAEAAPTDEIVELAKLLKPAGAIHTTHMRDESDHVLESLDESFDIGRRADVPVVISHHKTAGQANFGRSAESLAKIEDAIGRQPVGLDAYPYSASSTILKPEWVAEARQVLIAWSNAAPEQAGRLLADIATDWKTSEIEAATRLQPAGAIYFSMDEADVRRILAFPHTMIGSDGLPHDSHPHPRLWGTFPRVLGHYSREIGLFPLEEAVRKMTGLPARQFGLRNRGLLRPGYFADLTIFDPATVLDRATFEDPKQPAAGIAGVFVNGKQVWPAGAAANRPGRVLRPRQNGP